MFVLLIEILQPTAEVTVDYLQNSTPTMVAQLIPVDNSDGDVYLVTWSAVSAESSSATEAFINIRIEQSDLAAHHYLVLTSDAPPQVFDVTALKRALSVAGQLVGGGDFELTLTPDSVSTAAESTPPPGQIHLLGRGPHLILADPASAAVFIARSES